MSTTLPQMPKRTFVLEDPAPRPRGLGTGQAKTFDEMHAALKSEFSDSIIGTHAEEHKGDPFIVIKGVDLCSVISFLRNDPAYACNVLHVISAVDYYKSEEDAAKVEAFEPRIEVVYVLESHEHKHRFMVKVKLPRDNPTLPSICGLYRVANFHERECFDLLGVYFEGHPDLRRILLPDDWIGYPLRKDYVFPEEYNGMKVPL